MVFCVYCGRSFNRHEHLQRHVLTHTKVRPFRCVICHISFTRRDLVRKHYKVHTQSEVEAHEKTITESLKSSEALNAPPLEGQRASMACTSCAKTKTKCDQRNPCGRCQSRGLTCTLRVPKTAQHTDSLDDAQFSDPETRPGSEPGEDGVSDLRIPNTEADGNHPMPSIFSGVMSPESMSQAPPYQNNERYFGFSQLPYLDWQSLASNTAPAQNTNVLPTLDPNASDMNAFQDSALPTFEIFHESSGIQEDRSIMNDEMLFSFNTEENAWETRPSALSSIMGDFLQPHQTAPTIKLTAADSSPQSAQYSISGGSSEAHVWSPQDTAQQSDIVLPDEELDRWSLGQCTKSSLSTTYLSRENDAMRQGDQDSTTWSYAVERYRDSCFEPHERIETVDLTDETRDWMLIAIQQFLRAGMESQDAKKLSELLDATPGASAHSSERFLLLPPKASIQKYLDIFLTTFEPFTPMIPALSLNPNKLASRSREREATLLLFLMIAFGSMIDPAPRARQFSYELTEVCRHSLRRVTDSSGNITKQDFLTLQCALIFTCLTAFSGRRSHMDIGNTHRHMYLAMMRNAGYFRHSLAKKFYPFGDKNRLETEDQLEGNWKVWTDREIMSRLCYSWVIVDQEISLFYDIPAILLISELEVELPADDKLWMAPDSRSWKTAFDETQRNLNDDSHFSLHELFSLFVEDRLEQFGRDLTVMDMRLLLHPLHSMVSNYCQITASLNVRSKHSRITTNKILSSSSQTFEEIHDLTRRWLAVFQTLDVKGTRILTATRATLIQYHLISINLLCSFKTLEMFSRESNSEAIRELAFIVQEELNKHSPELLLHCGQILRHIRDADVKLRPPWWSIAVYRSMLVIWVYSITRQLVYKRSERSNHALVPAVALDILPFFDASLSHYLLYRRGDPHLTTEDGTIVPLDTPRAILQMGIEAFGRGRRLWRLTRGLQCKLQALYRNWDSVHEQLERARTD